MSIQIALAESGMLPDQLIRLGIRQLLAKRLRGLPNEAEQKGHQTRIIELLSQDALAVKTQVANEQHYEVPAAFFKQVLGERLKYSCCYFESESTPLKVAEESMLGLTCQRATLADGQRILELGCGWGSLTLWMAEQYPTAEITAISNSRSQREFIEQRLVERGLNNVQVVTQDVNKFQTDQKYDRVVSVEMFEHLRNYQELFYRISKWLSPTGLLFVHVFCHRHSAYLFEEHGSDNWMGRHFFTGGTMPSTDLFSHFQRDMRIQQQWEISGLHYWRTCEAWLANLDRNHNELLGIFKKQASRPKASVVLQRWRMFMMACAELFRYHDGKEWFVSHYLFSPSDV